MSVDEILAVVLEDREFYETSGGGVTVGGGEPLMQWQAVGTLLDACHREGISTAMETSGHAGAEVIRHIAPRVDLFLYDIKQMDSQRHRDLTESATNASWKTSTGFWTTDITCGCACRSSTDAMPTKTKSEPEPPFWRPGRTALTSRALIFCPITRSASRSTRTSAEVMRWMLARPSTTNVFRARKPYLRKRGSLFPSSGIKQLFLFRAPLFWVLSVSDCCFGRPGNDE